MVVVDFGFGLLVVVLGSGSLTAKDLMSVAGYDRSFLALAGVVATEVVAILLFVPTLAPRPTTTA